MKITTFGWQGLLVISESPWPCLAGVAQPSHPPSRPPPSLSRAALPASMLTKTKSKANELTNRFRLAALLKLLTIMTDGGASEWLRPLH